MGVGPSNILEMVNDEVAFYSRTGLLTESTDLSSFFGTSVPTSSLSGPRLFFDTLSQRWFASVANLTRSSILLAVSANSSAYSAWHVYVIPANTTEMAENAYLGTSSFMVALSANDYRTTGGGPEDGSQFWVLNKTQILNGALNVSSWSWGPLFGGGGHWPDNLRAVQSLTPGADQYFATLGAIEEQAITVTGAPPAVPVLTMEFGTIGTLEAPPSAAQPGTDLLIATGDGRIQTAVAQGDLITTTATAACRSYSCLRLDQIWASNGTMRQDYQIGSPGAYLYYPAAALDSNGDITIVAGFSNLTEFPSLAVVQQPYNEPRSVSGLYVAAVGSAIDDDQCTSDVCTYGQYFGASSDSSPGLNVWLAGEYETTGGTAWATRLTEAATFPATVSSPVSSPDAVDLGQGANFVISAVGGSGGFNYSWFGLPPGCPPTDSASVACSPSASGTYRVSVLATDSYGTSVSSTPTEFVVYPPLTAPVPTSDHPAADAGETVLFYATDVSGGSESYSYRWIGLAPTSCQLGNASSILCTFDRVGATSVQVEVNDSLGSSSTSPPLLFKIDPALVLSGMNVSSSSVVAGSPIRLSVNVTGGSGIYTYTWSGLPAGCPGENSSRFTCTPRSPGSYQISVSVTDSNGMNVTGEGVGVEVALSASGPAFSSLGAWPGVVAGIGLILLVLVGVVLLSTRRRPPHGPLPLRPYEPAGAIPGGVVEPVRRSHRRPRRQTNEPENESAPR
ncbi:MAG: hypothetical protein WA761_10420 [Thermoplasmata archaeon]